MAIWRGKRGVNGDISEKCMEDNDSFLTYPLVHFLFTHPPREAAVAARPFIARRLGGGAAHDMTAVCNRVAGRYELGRCNGNWQCYLGSRLDTHGGFEN